VDLVNRFRKYRDIIMLLITARATLVFIVSLFAATATVTEVNHVGNGSGLNCTGGKVFNFSWVVGQCKDDEMVTELDTNPTPRRCYYHNEHQFGDTSCATPPSGKFFYVCDVCFESQSGNYMQYSNCHAGSTAVTQRTGCDRKCSNCKAEASLPMGCQPLASANTSFSLGLTDCSNGLVKFKKFTSTTCDEVVWEKVIPLQLCSGLRDNCRVWVD
jgi:hypothetical protein